MSYNFHNQPQSYHGAPQQPQQNYQRPQQQPPQNYPTQQGPNPRQNQGGRQGFNDPFFNFGDTGFNMDIREDFEDPFEHMGNRLGGFGFPNIANMERQMLGQFQNEMQNMQQLSEGMNRNDNNQMQLRNEGNDDSYIKDYIVKAFGFINYFH